MLNGILLIDKPKGTRSADCVNRVRRALGRKGGKTRVGHAGTLDSTASGLLILLIGTATRLSDAVMTLPKTYRATLRLGQATDTCDASGQIIFEGDCGKVDDEKLRRALFAFLGWRPQRPPEISAVKLNGLPAHKLARAGQAVGLAPRPVFIQSISCSPIQEGKVELSVRCGKGTYIRALARDLGEALGCGAHVESLRRISSGLFHVEDAVSPDTAEKLISLGRPPLRPMREAISPFSRIVLTQEAEARIRNGLAIPLSGAGCCVPGTASSPWVCLEGEKVLSFAVRTEREGKAFLNPEANIFCDLEAAL